MLKTEPRRLEVMWGALGVGILCTSPILLVHPITELPREAWALILLSGLFETAYMVFLSAAYGAGDLSLVYPIARGTAPVLVTPLAILVLGERLSPLGILGIGLVVFGIFASQGVSSRLSPFAPGARRAVALAVLTGVMTAGYSLVNKVGVSVAPAALYAFLVFVVNGVLTWVVLWRRHALAWPLGRGIRPVRLVAIGILMMAAYMAVVVSMSLAPVSYVVAARETSIVVGALLGALVLKERQPVARLAGAAVIFAGVLVIALSR
jgi:drug/metabolite transporter (DMT)-like permease